VQKAFSYVRFSTKGQADGASLNRQLKSAREYAAKNNLQLDDSSYQDLGVSAFKGLNAVEGQLGAFIEAVERGIIPRGSFLLVESLDRISRNVITEAQALFMRILNLDITIVTLLDGQVFSKDKINEDGGISIIISLLYMLRAHEEQKTKAARVKDGWEHARNTKKIITSIAPSWLRIVDGKFEVIEEKAEVIRLIFKYAMEGMGSPSIAKRLGKEKVPVLGNSDLWSFGTVAGQMKNIAVIGHYQTPKIPLREDYYPAIIDKDVFFTVQQLITSRNLAPGIREGGIIGNIFAGRSYCGVCGTRMKTSSVNKARFLANPDGCRRYLICEAAYGVKTCRGSVRVPYDTFETQLLNVLIGLQRRNFFDLKAEVKYDPRPAIIAEISGKERGIEKHLDFMQQMPNSPALLKRLALLEKELETLKKDLSKAVPVSTTNDQLEDVAETYHEFKRLKKNQNSPEYRAMREKLQVGLRRVVKRIDFHHKPAEGDTRFFRITFVSGTVREWHYLYEPLVGGSAP
jgi:DNA invertase Pin-like site-specific DNA recombinase